MNRVLSRSLGAVALAAALGGGAPAQATEVLFVFVENGGYTDDGNQLADMIAALPGFNVTRRFLNADIYTDYASFNQVWVYDLNTGANNSPTQAANYANIATWYNGLAQRNLIVDGRIISSAPDWTSAGGFNPENAWIQSYALNMQAAGGSGLVLGTDHDDYHGGINEINAQIGIGAFSGFFGSYPTSQASVDTLSPLYVPIGICTGIPGSACINDNSTTGFVPAGLQANGQFLTPVAYHGTTSTAFQNAAVASTFASPTFVPEPGSLALAAAAALGAAGLAAAQRRRSPR